MEDWIVFSLTPTAGETFSLFPVVPAYEQSANHLLDGPTRILDLLKNQT